MTAGITMAICSKKVMPGALVMVSFPIEIEYGGMASEDINDWKELASDILKGTPFIDLADYVPREFHDKTCEAMAKAHQEEIADILERADIDRPQGEWIEVEEDWRHQIEFWKCSECEFAVSSMYNYCPNCGAKMKGADDE